MGRIANISRPLTDVYSSTYTYHAPQRTQRANYDYVHRSGLSDATFVFDEIKTKHRQHSQSIAHCVVRNRYKDHIQIILQEMRLMLPRTTRLCPLVEVEERFECVSWKPNTGTERGVERRKISPYLLNEVTGLEFQVSYTFTEREVPQAQPMHPTHQTAVICRVEVSMRQIDNDG